ncbi:hypothetical protein [Convivina praedatoris]|uniref:Uncharacterized protein n=1 Tax=Convivina praedatoris TaxID=2880963 RepID=A0ABN8HBN1_9LACO|nr:hypothetical protein [Convivina sp. LMG 32447]CAH1850394.1 hypothetical protein R078138_00125 [Convivina sp. LMG 32447]CAH1850799.1 hypothetical protein LMG032447_00207 [Convivina sp. LMG 32447]CAH1850817.1 hypothetical protein R077815_00205 [Convivina sp. LMG 32447]
MKQTFDLIEEITRLDGSIYYQLANVSENSRAEYAADHGFIKMVRILKMNIPRSKHVENIEHYINEHYPQRPLEYDGWEEWDLPDDIATEMKMILLDNKLG